MVLYSDVLKSKENFKFQNVISFYILQQRTLSILIDQLHAFLCSDNIVRSFKIADYLMN